MSDVSDLQARIAAVAGKINQHKQQKQHQHQHQQTSFTSPNRGVPRWAPYGRGSRQQLHRNRTLVLNNTPAATTDVSVQSSAAPAANHKLTIQDAHDRGQKKRVEAQEQQRALKRQKRCTEEQFRILRHVDSAGDATNRQMVIEGIHFHVTSDGAKLIRVPNDVTFAKETPKKVQIVGVDFYRTKHGNLLRASALRTPARHWTSQQQCEKFTKHGICASTSCCTGHDQTGTWQHRNSPWRTGRHSMATLTCFLGTCQFGPGCHFAHDPSKVAICPTYLHTAQCPNGMHCDLSHEMTYHRVPACQYFLRGNCTKGSACRYPHVFISPAALVCRAFATLGYCAKGEECEKRHVHECPDYANSGFCSLREKGHCALPHPDRASTLRKAAERQERLNGEDLSDLSSNEDDAEVVDDIDSDLEDFLKIGVSDDTHELSQQQDFVRFN